MSFPDGFLWGASTAAHQVEGGNVNNDSWLLEHAPASLYAEPSGDACDHYHRYPDDIALMAELGFGAYRFSLEWSRIEPEDGEFSRAALDHYRRMLATCHEHGVDAHGHLPPLHLAALVRRRRRLGGRRARRERFARFCERAMRHLGDLVPVCVHAQRAEPGPLLHGSSASPPARRRGLRRRGGGARDDARAARRVPALREPDGHRGHAERPPAGGRGDQGRASGDAGRRDGRARRTGRRSRAARRRCSGSAGRPRTTSSRASRATSSACRTTP